MMGKNKFGGWNQFENKKPLNVLGKTWNCRFGPYNFLQREKQRICWIDTDLNFVFLDVYKSN